MYHLLLYPANPILFPYRTADQISQEVFGLLNSTSSNAFYQKHINLIMFIMRL